MDYRHSGLLLIVEDDERLRELLIAAAMKTELYSAVHAAPDGQAALDYIHLAVETGTQEAPDFVLTDLSMPRLDGFQLLQAVKGNEATKHIPVAIMTSSNLPNDRTTAKAGGCCAFFNKPVKFEELVTLVGSLPKICGAEALVTAHHPAAAG